MADSTLSPAVQTAMADIPGGKPDSEIEKLLLVGSAKAAAYELRQSYGTKVRFMAGFQDLETLKLTWARACFKDPLALVTLAEGTWQKTDPMDVTLWPRVQGMPDAAPLPSWGVYGETTADAPVTPQNLVETNAQPVPNSAPKGMKWKLFDAVALRQMNQWVWDNLGPGTSSKQTSDSIFQKFGQIIDGTTPDDQMKIGPHCLGRAFDIEPAPGLDANMVGEIETALSLLPNLDRTLHSLPATGEVTQNKSGVRRWHCQFKAGANEPTYAEMLAWSRFSLRPEYVFVITLENRSFDHLFGFSKLRGLDATTGNPRLVNGVLQADGKTLKDGMWNEYDDGVTVDGSGALVGPQKFPVSADKTPWMMPGDPSHEFEHILTQTCGYAEAVKIVGSVIGTDAQAAKNAPAPGQTWSLDPSDYAPPGQSGQSIDPEVPSLPPLPAGYDPPKAFSRPYPKANLGGFVASWVRAYTPQVQGFKPVLAPEDYDYPMRCFDTPNKLRVFHELAKQFVLCDAYFSSAPLPTCPSRMFMMAASSGGLDHSPTTGQTVGESYFSHLGVPNGHIFDRFDKKFGAGAKTWTVVSDDGSPMAGVLEGVHNGEIIKTQAFKDLLSPSKSTYPYKFTWIEPDYDNVDDVEPGRYPQYSRGNSMHPASDARDAEKFVFDIYSAIRLNEEVWSKSVIFVLWDEHGGFYNHVTPPRVAPPPQAEIDECLKNNNAEHDHQYNQWGFKFDTLGIRIPALVVSPLVDQGVLDGTTYDHCSFIKTVTETFGLAGIARDKSAATKSMSSLFSRKTPRQGCPTPGDLSSLLQLKTYTTEAHARDSWAPDGSNFVIAEDTSKPPSGNLLWMLASAVNIELSANKGNSAAQDAIRKKYQGVKTIKQAREFLNDHRKQYGAAVGPSAQN